MKNQEELRKILNSIDGRGYKAYKGVQGKYDFKNYVLSIDAVQGDPFASPSKARIIVSQDTSQFPQNLYATSYKNRALCDFLTRLFHHNIYKHYDKVGGSGKSGLLSVDNPGQEILERTSVIINNDRVEVRFEVGLPAAGRRVLGKSAIKIFFDYLPQIVNDALFYKNIDSTSLIEQINLSEDQYYLRNKLKEMGLVAFINNGAVLPRESGVSEKPMKKGYIPFSSPKSFQVEFNLPHKGKISGMGIPEGITLIVGGGYHGKSTLLRSLERSVYDHILGDGREYIITREDAVKIRAEDGRRIEKVNISPFINNLPNNKDTLRFSTDNASGSTSQAANIMEALEIGTYLLLIDEDTCATNFMVRDNKMKKLVSKDKEPITPFITRVRYLYEELGISTIMVVGSSGDYFEVADNIIMMDEYIPRDVTKDAKEIVSQFEKNNIGSADNLYHKLNRILLKTSFPSTRKGIRIKTKGLHNILYNKTAIDLKYLEQLVDKSQTTCIALIIEYLSQNLASNNLTLPEMVQRVYNVIEKKGLDELSKYSGHPGNLAMPRKHEVIATLNRFRHLNILSRD